ncbi:MAG: acetyl-CoA carboxylase biotin carboxylase subunit [Clostridiales bacterium]|jgi:pyruvate carboxylase subunit A|nr:acetyl-CoA carboxylase biotin carboxylase subunit [Eubacteriales bacterium]MDH7565364.1 acetyl-CoA carboxylase biotin carboxylase subunit [Clostridiales bacterium]
MFKKVLVANRGEIAVRIIRALKEMNIHSVAIYSDCDRDSLHRMYADSSYPLHGNKAADTYMNMEKILRIAKESNVDAIHPGYGFLAENEDFAELVEKNGITFIGPKSKTIELMGNKIAARKMMAEAGIPTVPGSVGGVASYDEAKRIADAIGYPLLIKAAAGGGGVGMRVVQKPEDLQEMFERARHQAESVFGDGTVFIEKYIDDARHIEFQIFADKYGNVVHLGDRDCSIQRRHQKIIEESPSSALDEATREKMGEVAVSIARVADYQTAGTVEFIFSKGEFYFLEMNTRLQVEHPVTEMLTGIDIVKTQISLAAGNPLPFTQEEIHFRGHAIECRICAEDPLNGFMPSPSRITDYRTPGGIGVRVDSGVYKNFEITSHYDSMISKLIVWGSTRKEAVARMQRALREYVITGPKTNIPYLCAVMDCGEFQSGTINTKFVEEHPQLFDTAKAICEQLYVPFGEKKSDYIASIEWRLGFAL